MEQSVDDKIIDLAALRTYTNGLGREITLQPVSLLFITQMQQDIRQRYMDAGRPIDTPTAMAKTAVGEEEYELTADNLERPKDPEGTERNKTLWVEHQKAVREMSAEIAERVNGYSLTEGVVVEEDENWEALMGWLEQSIPENPRDRKLLYIKTQMLVTPEDIQVVLFRIQILSAGRNITQDQLRAIEALFRRPIPISGDALADIIERFTDKVGELATQPDVRGDADGESVGDTAEPVEATERGG